MATLVAPGAVMNRPADNWRMVFIIYNPLPDLISLGALPMDHGPLSLQRNVTRLILTAILAVMVLAIEGVQT
jgi:hypothetical protein